MPNRTIVGARAFADVQVRDRHPHPIRLKCGWCLGGIRRRTEQSVDLLRDVWELTLQIWAGTGGRSEPLVHGEVAGLVAGVVELYDVVALADIRAERDELGERRIADVPVPADLVICNLDGDGAVVVGAVGTAPASVCFIHIQSDPAVRADAVVGAGFSAGGRKHTAALLHGKIASHMVDGDLVNGVISRFAAVRTKLRVIYKTAVAHVIFPPFRRGHGVAPARPLALWEWAGQDGRRSPAGTRPHWRCRRR